MIIKEKEITVEKTFEPFTIELTFEKEEDVQNWLAFCHLGRTADQVRYFTNPKRPINIITRFLIKKGF